MGDYSDKYKWDDDQTEAMGDDNMEDDNDSIDRFIDDGKSPQSDFLRGLPRSSQRKNSNNNNTGASSNSSWANEEKSDLFSITLEKHIVHQNFYNAFDDDFDDDDLA